MADTTVRRILMTRTLALFVVVCTGLMAQAGQGLKLPFAENFSSPPVEYGWKEVIATGGKIDVKDGWATFEAPLTSTDHIERALDVDNVTVSAKLVRWSGFYLVWDEQNWCGVGKVSPTPFGRFYSIDVVNGKTNEVDHRGVDFNLPHTLRMQLGADHVRFQYLLDAKWVELRTMERPRGFSGAPKLIRVGKYYGSEDKPYNVVGDDAKTAKASGAIRELRVELTSPKELKLTKAELKAVRTPPPEPVGALLRSGKEDPSFETVAPFYPPMKSPREIVGVAGHALDIGVDRLGRLDVSPWSAAPVAWFEVGDAQTPFGAEGVPFRRRLLHGYLPVLTLSRAIDGAQYDMTVLGISENFSATNHLFACVKFSVRALDGRPLPKSVSMVWEKGRRAFPLKAEDDGSASCCLQFKYPTPSSVTEISATEYQSKVDATVAYWKERLKPAERFDLPDARVEEAYRAWLVYSLLNADTINGYVEPHDGAGFYEEMFGISVSTHTMALDYYGMHDYAAQVLDTQIHFQDTNGLYTQACGLTDPGAFLAGLARHYEMTSDRAWFRRVAPNVIKQCEWLVAQRKVAPKDGMMRGLIKFRPYNDFQYPVFNFLGNAWCAQGMKFAAAALKENGFVEGDKFAAEADQYRTDVLDSMDASKIIRDGQTILPMEPDTQRLLKMSKYRGGDYYGLVASSLLETEFLAPNDKRAAWIVDALEKRGGLIAGVCEFEGGIDHAYTFGYLLNEMKREEVRKTLLGFWSFCAFGMTRETYSPVEVTMIGTGENHYTLPHLYSCTEQLRLLRNLLVREDGSVLWLGQGLPRAWLEQGKHVAVTSAPSEFGELSYRIDPQTDGTMRITIDPPTRRVPAEVRLRLRHPQMQKIAAVDCPRAVEVDAAKETVVLRNLNAAVDLLVHFN